LDLLLLLGRMLIITIEFLIKDKNETENI
jgi:hypothetical protein